MYQLYIFDMDGTILNSLEDLADALNYSLKETGYPLRTLEEVRQFVGNGIRKLIERALPKDASDAEIDRVFDVFYPYYKKHCGDKTRPYKGIDRLLAELKEAGAKIAVVSNKADGAVNLLVNQYFDGIFDVAVGERQGVQKKPAPDSVYEVLRQLGIEKENAVYIGDSEVDIETAKNAGMDEIAVSWGFRGKEFLKSQGAVRFADKPEEIFSNKMLDK